MLQKEREKWRQGKETHQTEKEGVRKIPSEKESSLVLALATAFIFALCILFQHYNPLAGLGAPDTNWIVVGMIGLGLGSLALYLYYSRVLAVIAFGGIMSVCFVSILWLYWVHYGLFAKYGFAMPISILGLIGLVFSLSIVGLAFRNPENLGFPAERPDVSRLSERIRILVFTLSEIVGVLGIRFVS